MRLHKKGLIAEAMTPMCSLNLDSAPPAAYETGIILLISGGFCISFFVIYLLFSICIYSVYIYHPEFQVRIHPVALPLVISRGVISCLGSRLALVYKIYVLLYPLTLFFSFFFFSFFLLDT
ncbi:hypothetical protein F4810DRAFT_658373 [Camillea tinctor]|nr:hypothetical protein F4810DRAFT_658373 [Camillea tinctor]